MELSILIPVYNAEAYVSRTIQSILSQNYSDFELVLVDDGCSDRSAMICDEWERKDRRITVIHQKNAGIGGARNIGLKKAFGKYIGFVDNDDLIHPQMHSILIDVAKKTNADVVMSFEEKVYENQQLDITEFDLDDKCYNSVPIENYFRSMFASSEIDGPYMAVWNKIYSKKVLNDIYFPNSGAEDVFFNSKVLLKAESFYEITPDIKLYFWVQRKTSEWHNKFSDYQLRTLQTYFNIVDELDRNHSPYINYALEKTAKKILSARYNYNKTAKKNDIKKIIKQHIKRFLKLFLLDRRVKLRIKSSFVIMYFFPFIYSFFRFLKK